MESIDVFCGGILLFSAYKGFRNGLFVEVASLVSMILGLYFAVKFSSFVGVWLHKNWQWNQNTIKVSAFCFTFLGIVIGISFLAKIFTKIANWSSLGLLNNFGGSTIRVIKGVLILSIALRFFDKVNFNHAFVSKEKLTHSVFYQPIKSTGKIISPLMENIFETLKEKIK